MLLASAGGNSVPVIARLLAADEDTVREVIHRFNEIGLDCLDPEWAGGRPRLLCSGDEDFVAATASTRPGKLGVPLLALVDSEAGRVSGRVCVPAGPHWPGGAAYPAAPAPDHVPAHLDVEGVHRPDIEANLERIEDVLDHHPDRAFAFDEFGPPGIRPTAGTGWAGRNGHKGQRILRWAAAHAVELCFTPTYASWANPIEAHFGALRQFTLANSNHPNHVVQTRRLHEYLRWRNAHARHPDVLEAQRRERARIRSEKGHRWGRHDAPRAA